MKKYIVLGSILASLTLVGNTATADAISDKFDNRLNGLNEEILRGEKSCSAALDILINEFENTGIYVANNYDCAPDRQGRAQIKLREF